MIWALHGAVGMTEDWGAFSSEMGEVRALDLWGLLGGRVTTLDQAGEAIADEVSRVDTSPVLVGYSMGGRLALHALLDQPGLWKAAIIISAHPGMTGERERVERQEKDARWGDLAGAGEWTEFLKQWESQGVLGEALMPCRMALESQRAAVAKSFTHWSLGVQADLRKIMHRISCPVLWLTGERDVKFTQLAEAAVAYLPRASHHAIPDCGHRVPWGKPAEFTEACRDFLATIS